MKAKAIAVVAALITAVTTATTVASDHAVADHRAGPVARAGSYRVTVTVSETEPLVGTKVKIKAKVRPAAPGAEVTLQVKHAGKGWKTIDHARLRSSSKVSFTDKIKTVQERRYRVVKPAGPSRGAGQGSTGQVTVYGWRSLVSIPYVSSHGWMQSAVNMNAVTYTPALISYHDPLQPYQVDYNLARRCLLLDATYGTSDNSPNAGASSETVVGDGVELFTGAYSFTGSQHVVTDVRGVFRLSLLGTSTNGGIAAVGRPQVLCSF